MSKRPKQESEDTATAAIDWSGIFFDPANDLPGKLMARARKRYGVSPDAEAAYNYALDQISADQFSGLGKRYAGTGSAAGFLSISFLNCMEEYARHKYPRVRPPAWLKRLGNLWIRTWQMLCLQRSPTESIVDALGENTAQLRDEVRYATVEIKRRVPNCGQYVAEQTVANDEAAHAQPDGSEAPDDVMEHDTVVALLEVLGGMLKREITVPQATTLQAIVDAVVLSDQERLLLKLVYEQGNKIAGAARALGLQRKQASRLHASVLAKLRAAFDPLGLS